MIDTSTPRIDETGTVCVHPALPSSHPELPPGPHHYLVQFADGRGRRYLIERGIACMAELQAIVADYVAQAGDGPSIRARGFLSP